MWGLGLVMWDLMLQLFGEKPQKQKQFDETQRKRVVSQTVTQRHRPCGDPRGTNPEALGSSSAPSPGATCLRYRCPCQQGPRSLHLRTANSPKTPKCGKRGSHFFSPNTISSKCYVTRSHDPGGPRGFAALTGTRTRRSQTACGISAAGTGTRTNQGERGRT